MGAETVDTPATSSRGKSPKTAGTVMIIGGILLAVGSLLQFAKLEGFGISETVSGLDTDDGKLFLGVGVALLIFGGVILGVASATARRIFGVLGVLISAFMVWAAIVDITGIGSDIPAEFAGQIEASAGIGLYVVLAGAVAGLIGSAMAVFAPKEAAVAPPPPPPGETAPPPPA